MIDVIMLHGAVDIDVVDASGHTALDIADASTHKVALKQVRCLRGVRVRVRLLWMGGCARLFMVVDDCGACCCANV
jgi:hypothetical protein